MAKGVPIRLVQENGNLIELDATSMVLSTTRKVGGSALPWTGSRRIGMDWNINKAMINIQGVIADDRVGTVANANSASIDFGHITYQSVIQMPIDATGIPSSFVQEVIAPWTTTDSNLTKLLGMELRLQSYTAASDSALDKITFTNTASAGATAYSSNGGAGSSPTILVHTGDGTPEQMATAVAAYINAQLSSKYSATVPANGGKKATASGGTIDASTLVIIKMATTGADTSMKIKTPRFHQVTNAGAYFKDPIINKFAGGSESVRKSAGDKVQDLYGIINNSSRTWERTAKLMSGRNKLYGWGSQSAEAMRDYIVGIQIPYNSTIKAEGGEEYVARNFFMPTGMYFGKDKTSEGNDHPASVDMSGLGDERRGIQGAVQKLDITYDAGESVYSFNMIFAPIDNMILS